MYTSSRALNSPPKLRLQSCFAILVQAMSPVKPKPAKFVFERYDADVAHGSVVFHYSMERDGRVENFQEKLSFAPPTNPNISAEAVDTVIKHLFILSGIGYWKAWCATTIEVRGVSLAKSEAEFWNTIYTKGMGEYYYRNNIDFRDLLRFPITEDARAQPTPINLSPRALLLVGGGKDSIVSEQLLRQAGKPFDSYALSPAALQTSVMELMGQNIVSIKRELDAKLLELNTEPDTYNGHTPISCFYALTAILAALLYDYRYIVASNEHSANYGNVEYLGMTINHQWSKSLEFEKLFQSFVRDHVSPDVEYFSLLRPYSEIKIVSLFAGATKYYELFSSCNRNFTLTKQQVPHRWCGQCAKCAFVFAMLAAFVSKEELFKIFGKNLFADPLLIPIYRDLLGLTNIKPFDCVGTPEETALAFLLAQKKNEYDNDLAMQMFQVEARAKFADATTLKKQLLETNEEASIPKEFQSLVA